MKKIILAVTIGLFSISAFAQKQQNRHEVSIWGGGGISSLQYDATISGNKGDHKIGTGGIVGIGYDYYFNYNWSLGGGVEFSALAGKTKFPLVYDEYVAPIPDFVSGGNQLIRFRTESQDFYERQRAYYINIPVMARFQFDLFRGHKFYAAAGPKFGIPVDAIYRSNGALETSGLKVNAAGVPVTTDWYIGQRDNGFDTYRRHDVQDLKLGFNFIAALEAGIKWRFKENKHWNMYTGLYADFGLNDIVKGNGDPAKYSDNLFDYNVDNPREHQLNSIFYTRGGKFEEDNTLKESVIANRVNTFAFGAKVRVSYGWKRFDKKGRLKQIEEAKPYEGLTAAQMEEIMGRNTKALIDAQQKEFEELKKMLSDAEPDFTGSITGFDLGKYDLLSEMIPDLDKKVSIMKKYPRINVVLEGHTDDYGSDKLNYQLGLDRSNSVKDYMMQHGIASSRMSITSKGSKNPAIPNANESNRRYNRRVEFILRQ